MCVDEALHSNQVPRPNRRLRNFLDGIVIECQHHQVHDLLSKLHGRLILDSVATFPDIDNEPRKQISKVTLCGHERAGQDMSIRYSRRQKSQRYSNDKHFMQRPMIAEKVEAIRLSAVAYLYIARTQNRVRAIVVEG